MWMGKQGKDLRWILSVGAKSSINWKKIIKKSNTQYKDEERS